VDAAVNFDSCNNLLSPIHTVKGPPGRNTVENFAFHFHPLATKKLKRTAYVYSLLDRAVRRGTAMVFCRDQENEVGPSLILNRDNSNNALFT